MSQVQPPRSRQSHRRLETILLTRSVIIYAGTFAVTALLLRAAIMLAVPNTTERGLRLVARVTYLVVWPVQRIPLLQHSVVRGLTLADVATLLIVVSCWLVALGVVAGWEHEGHRQNLGSSQTGPRP